MAEVLNTLEEKTFDKSITDISTTKIRQKLREEGKLKNYFNFYKCNLKMYLKIFNISRRLKFH
jgi:hypothetical protein